jgi:hypothetical protein
VSSCLRGKRNAKGHLITQKMFFAYSPETTNLTFLDYVPSREAKH